MSSPNLPGRLHTHRLVSNIRSIRSIVCRVPEQNRLDWAYSNLHGVASQLREAAAFGKHLTPEVLERAATRIDTGLQIYVEETRS